MRAIQPSNQNFINADEMARMRFPIACQFVDRQVQELEKSWQMTSLYVHQFNFPIVHYAQVSRPSLETGGVKTPPTTFRCPILVSLTN
jgi:hypothetical protein